MKQVLLPVALLISIATNAQQIKLSKGQRISISSTTNQEIDMGMGQMKNNSVTTSVLDIKDADTKNYNAVYTLTKLSLEIEGMGQSQSYDSDKPEDKDSEMGKAFGEDIGKETKVTIDKNSGNTTAEKAASPEKEDVEDENNPFAGITKMMGAADTESGITESAFFLIPAGKKAGDSWSDSVNVKDGMKGKRTYTLKSIDKNMATIAVFLTVEGRQDLELQGMQLEVNLSGKTEGELLVDTKTSLVKKSSRVADITGTMGMMGQSMPVSAKMTETTEYN